jgi:hypothetical protein
MHMSAHSAQVMKGKQPRLLTIRTTLYDLIATISAEVRADEEDLIVATVVHLLRTRRETHRGTLTHSRLVIHQGTTSQYCRRRAAITTPSHLENIDG